MNVAAPTRHEAADSSAVLSKATIRAAARLGITNRVLAAVIGLSESSVSRLKNGEYALEPGEKSFELGVLFVRLYRSLDSVAGGDEAVARAWLRGQNTALGAVPLDLIQTISGLMHVIQYLDARRAIV